MALTEPQLADMEQWAAFDLGSGTAKDSGDRVQEIVDEVRALRARVAELEELHDAAAKANEALEQIGEQARQRIVELTRGLREALDACYDRVLDGDVPKRERLYRLADRAEAETPVQPDLPSTLCERIVALAHEAPNGEEILFCCVDVLDAARIDLQAAPPGVVAEKPAPPDLLPPDE